MRNAIQRSLCQCVHEERRSSLALPLPYVTQLHPGKDLRDPDQSPTPPSQRRCSDEGSNRSNRAPQSHHSKRVGSEDIPAFEPNLHVVSREAVEVAERVGVQKQGINTVRVFVEWDGFTIEEEGIDDGRSTRTWGLLKAVKSEVELGRIRRATRRPAHPNARTTGGTAGIARKRKSAVEREDRDNQKTTGRD
ncbi:hypothetical protein NL676_008411 [Syzygium grande]|nr:hypothetical protein NL676_008411 [Syzygium grande]